MAILCAILSEANKIESTGDILAVFYGITLAYLTAISASLHVCVHPLWNGKPLVSQITIIFIKSFHAA